MGNNTLRWSEKKCEQQVKVAFQADQHCWSALWPWTGNATMLKLLSRVENVQQIVWPRFQEQLTVIRAVVEKPDGASLLPRLPPPCSTPTATTIELKSIKKSQYDKVSVRERAQVGDSCCSSSSISNINHTHCLTYPIAGRMTSLCHCTLLLLPALLLVLVLLLQLAADSHVGALQRLGK